MLSKRVTRVSLTAITEEACAGPTSFVGTPMWRVEWDKIEGTKIVTGRHSHYTEAGARQHAKNLLAQVDPELGNVYFENCD